MTTKGAVARALRESGEAKRPVPPGAPASSGQEAPVVTPRASSAPRSPFAFDVTDCPVDGTERPTLPPYTDSRRVGRLCALAFGFAVGVIALYLVVEQVTFWLAERWVGWGWA